MREEGISQKRDIILFPLLPFPLSLTLKAKPPPTAEPKKPPLRRVMIGIGGNRCRARRNSFDLRRDPAYGDFATIPATMGHSEPVERGARHRR